ncbi:hypothetical protein F4778DRAFT_49558 [Xylariomycetidae sp. FL2044]|nr:hypothetical protein F4778DRAFT_49558 [Xylariomycetidae sp. FL2044]
MGNEAPFSPVLFRVLPGALRQAFSIVSVHRLHSLCEQSNISSAHVYQTGGGLAFNKTIEEDTRENDPSYVGRLSVEYGHLEELNCKC